MPNRIMDKEYNENRIARFLNGNCTEAELQELKNWIDHSPGNKKEYLAIKDVWDSTRLQKSTDEEQLSFFYKNQYEKSKKSRMLWIRSTAVAAILLVGLVLSVLIPPKSTHYGESFHVFSVPLGSRSKVLLADGTEVSLNSGSELKYSSHFSSTNREVQLSGEGYFNVTTDKHHPFLVKTTDFEVTVTGTRFNVCTYAENKNTSAALVEGNIQLKMNDTRQILDIDPGQKFELNRQTRKYSLKNTDMESEIAWKDGEFIFKNIAFPDLVQRLERWYDVKLHYSDVRLQDFNYTGKFKNQETIWQVLDALKLTSPIDYRKNTFREFNLIYKPLTQK